MSKSIALGTRKRVTLKTYHGVAIFVKTFTLRAKNIDSAHWKVDTVAGFDSTKDPDLSLSNWHFVEKA